MAKISKKDRPPSDPIDSSSMVQFIMDGMEDALQAKWPEPINHIPHVDMYSTKNTLEISIDIPGVRKEDIEITLLQNTLKIVALKYECFEDDEINYICMERAFGRIFRTVEIPFPINTTQMKAYYKQGILKIILPRVEEKRGKPKSIAIETIE